MAARCHARLRELEDSGMGTPRVTISLRSSSACIHVVGACHEPGGAELHSALPLIALVVLSSAAP